MSNDIHLKAVSLEIPQQSIIEISMQIAYITFHSNLPGINELTQQNKAQQNCMLILWDILC